MLQEKSRILKKFILKMNKRKKAVSSVVISVLMILLAIAAATAIFFVVKQFTENLGEKQAGLFSTAKFEIQKISEDDMLFDRFAIKNTGGGILTRYNVKIDGELVGITVHKIINPLEVKYIY